LPALQSERSIFRKRGIVGKNKMRATAILANTF
jgi:hypothetical protein